VTDVLFHYTDTGLSKLRFITTDIRNFKAIYRFLTNTRAWESTLSFYTILKKHTRDVVTEETTLEQFF